MLTGEPTSLHLTPNLTPTRVLIVEDHPLVIQGLRRVIEAEADMLIVGEASRGDDAVRLAGELAPNIILMDVNLPGKNGLQATIEIKRLANCEETGVIILTAYDDEEQQVRALRAGAAAYFPKDVRPSELLPAMRAIAQGKHFINGKVTSRVDTLRWLAEKMERSVPATAHGAFAPLSDREQEVLQLLVRGDSNKEIARTLHIHYQTVKNHVSSVLHKLAVEDRTQAAVLALRRGLVRLEEKP